MPFAKEIAIYLAAPWSAVSRPSDVTVVAFLFLFMKSKMFC